MHNLVPEKGHEEGAESDDQDTGIARDIGVHSIDELRADDGVHGGPSDASQDIEKGDQLHSPPAEPEAREHHLTQTKARAES